MSPAPAKRNTKMMNRFELTTRLVSKLKNEEAVIGGIGNSNFDLWNAGRRPQNFYMLGSMGLTAPIALGVALAQPQRRVFALEGDGSILMQLGSLATIAALRPRNLTIIVWDNGLYQITGSQPTATAAAADVVEIARGAGSHRAPGRATKRISNGWSSAPQRGRPLVHRGAHRRQRRPRLRRRASR